MGYVKVWSQITTSSINDCAIHVRWMWVVLLSQANRHGQVHGTVDALARLANLSPKQTREALDVLAAPDPNSTSPDHDGRRIESLGGNMWQIINYHKYRMMVDPDERRETERDRKRAQRAQRGGGDDLSADVPTCPSLSQDVAQAEAEAEAYKEAKKNKKGAAFAPPTATQVQEYLDSLGEVGFTGSKFVDYYAARGWMLKGGQKVKDWKACVRTWQRNRQESAPLRIVTEVPTSCPHCGKYKDADAEACEECAAFLRRTA